MIIPVDCYFVVAVIEVFVAFDSCYEPCLAFSGVYPLVDLCAAPDNSGIEPVSNLLRPCRRGIENADGPEWPP